MLVTEQELSEAPRCPVCDAVLVVTPSGFIGCSEHFGHTKLIVPGDTDLDKLRRVRAISELPVAEKGKKQSIYKCNDGFYGRVAVNDGTHWEGEFIARRMTKSGWQRVRLVPIPKRAVAVGEIEDQQKEMW